MRKITFFLLACIFLFQTANAVTINAPVKASDIIVPLGKTGKTINLQTLSVISTEQFEDLTGKKLGVADKLMFKAAQRKIRNSINKDGTINNKKIERLYHRKYDSDDHGFNLGGFALGFLLGLVGVLIAYIINNDRNHSRRTWAWIGFGIFLVLYLIIAAASLSNWN